MKIINNCPLALRRVGIGFKILGLFLVAGYGLANAATQKPEQKIEIKAGVFPGLPTSHEGGFLRKVGTMMLAASASEQPRGEEELSIWACPLPSDNGAKSPWKESARTLAARISTEIHQEPDFI